MLRFFCPSHLYEEIEGDLIQKFNKDANPPDDLNKPHEYWIRNAKWKLFWNTIQFFRLGIVLRNRFTMQFIQISILSNYLKIGFRSLARRKVHSFITVFGLSLGLAVCLVIYHYAEFEKSYDDFHKNGDLIYRTVFTGYENGEKNYFSPRFGYGLGPSLKEDMPEVTTFVRIREENAIVRNSDSSGKSILFDEKIDFVDSTFFDVFTYKALHGDLLNSLDKKSSIVLTQSAAIRYFGNPSLALGKMLDLSTQYGVNGVYEITAVIEDTPGNSHFQFELLVPIHNLLSTPAYREPGAQWDWVNFFTYVMVHPGSNLEAMNSKTDALLTKYTGPNPPGSFVFTFQPLRQIHISEQEDNLFGKPQFLMLIAFFILSIAWINFINLSTSRAIERAKEVGIKKAIGVLRTQLISQFITESLLVNFVSIAFAVIISLVLLPWLGEMTGNDLSFRFGQVSFWVLISSVWIAGSLISGIYPAAVLSSFKTIHVIKGRMVSTGIGLFFRKGLIVFQFASSLLLIVGTLTIYKQIQFMLLHEKGMNTYQMLIVESPKRISEADMEYKLSSFKNEIAGYSFVQNIATSGSTPGNGYSLITGMLRLGEEENPNHRETIYVIDADPDFIRTYDIKLASGRSWNSDLISDAGAVLLNETALEMFGLGDTSTALNERVVIDNRDTVSILGVFKDVHWNSLHTANIPLLLRPRTIAEGQFSIHINSNTHLAVSEIEAAYKKTFPGNPFNFYFLDDFFDHQYKSDRAFGKMMFFFSALAIVIACLGLWGLTSFTTLQRRKEIGIRKISGAAVHRIAALLSMDYLRLLMLAVLIALPLMIYGIDEWLHNYAFRMSITFDLFIFPVVLLLLITLLTVGWQIAKAAWANPIDSLRE